MAGPETHGFGPPNGRERSAHSPGRRVVLGPDPDELVQVVGTQDGRVPCEVLEVVHDDGHKEVEHLQDREEGATWRAPSLPSHSGHSLCDAAGWQRSPPRPRSPDLTRHAVPRSPLLSHCPVPIPSQVVFRDGTDRLLIGGQWPRFSFVTDWKRTELRTDHLEAFRVFTSCTSFGTCIDSRRTLSSHSPENTYLLSVSTGPSIWGISHKGNHTTYDLLCLASLTECQNITPFHS